MDNTKFLESMIEGLRLQIKLHESIDRLKDQRIERLKEENEALKRNAVPTLERQYSHQLITSKN